jgi:hypothetical protein
MGFEISALLFKSAFAGVKFLLHNSELPTFAPE